MCFLKKKWYHAPAIFIMHSRFTFMGSTYRFGWPMFVILLACNLFAKSQTATYSFVPADSAFVMEVSRSKNEVIISIAFNDSLVFDNVSIEREPSFSQNFSQCGYFDYADLKKKGRHLVKKDLYPFPASNDVLYRLKFTTVEGVIRTYPPVMLPAVSK
jgi:hypothetical protein